MIDKLGLDGLGGASVRVEPAVVSLEPVAFMTHHDDPMLFPTWGEAVQYCDDNEPPISLFHADDVAKLQADLAAMTQERNALKEKQDNFCMQYRMDCDEESKELEIKLLASQAYSQQLREALDICKREMQGDKWDALYIDGVLAGK